MSTQQEDKLYLQRAVDLARENVKRGGQPFGAVLVHQGKVLADGVNESYIDFDLTAHAEIQALRNAAHEYRRMQFQGATMYASGKPCVMCSAAMIHAGIARVVYAAGDDMGDPFGWGTQAGYQQLQAEFGAQGYTADYVPMPEKSEIYLAWKNKHESS